MATHLGAAADTGAAAGAAPPASRAERPRWQVVHFTAVSLCLVGLDPAHQLPNLITQGQAATKAVAYALVSMVVALPVMLTQIHSGSKADCGLVGLFSKFSPIFKGVGVAFLVRSLQGVLSLQMAVGHILFYLWGSLMSPQAWSSCDNTWNTPQCVTGTKMAGNRNFTSSNFAFVVSYNEAAPQKEYFLHHINDSLGDNGMSDVISDVGSLVPTDMAFHKAVTLGIAWAFVLIIAIPGVKAFGWMVVIFGMLLISLLSALLGYGWYLRPYDPLVGLKVIYGSPLSQMTHRPTELLMESMKVALYSFGLLSGVYPAIGRFSGDHYSRRCWTVVFSWSVVNLFPHIIILILVPLVANLRTLQIRSADDVLFILWPQIVSHLELHQSVAAIFYFTFFILGILYAGLIVSVLSDALTEGCGKYRDAYHSAATTFICIIGLGASLLFTTDVGYQWKRLLTGHTQEMDFLYVLFLLIFFCIFQAKMGAFQGLTNVFSGVWFSISCFVLLVVSIAAIYYQDDLTVAAQQPPIRWLISNVPLMVCLFCGALHAMCVVTNGELSQGTKYCAVLCCGENKDHRTNVICPETVTAGVVVSSAMGTSGTYVPNYQESAPPYTLYDNRPIHPAPNGSYNVPKTPDHVVQQAWVNPSAPLAEHPGGPPVAFDA